MTIYFIFSYHTHKLVYLFIFLHISFVSFTERKESKASIINTTEEIDTQTGLGATTTAAGTATSSFHPPQPPQAATAVPTPSPPRTTVHEENEKTGETNDVSDKSK